MASEVKLDRQLNIRATSADVERLDRVSAALNARTPGIEINRSAVARAAILRGLDALEAELGIASATAPKKPRK